MDGAGTHEVLCVSFHPPHHVDICFVYVLIFVTYAVRQCIRLSLDVDSKSMSKIEYPVGGRRLLNEPARPPSLVAFHSCFVLVDAFSLQQRRERRNTNSLICPPVGKSCFAFHFFFISQVCCRQVRRAVMFDTKAVEDPSLTRMFYTTTCVLNIYFCRRNLNLLFCNSLMRT